MELLNFLNIYKDNWAEKLTASPYCLSIKTYGDYVLFKYNQFDSDFSEQIVREARGSIFRREGDEWICVCRPFDKFFNYGEPYAADLDWRAVKVTEKIDGSLMKMWYDRGEWHLSTNGTINAFNCFQDDTNVSFGAIFERALGKPYTELGWFLDKSQTHLFELTSPETKIVVPYSDGVYYLGSRNIEDGDYFYNLPLVYIHEDKMNVREVKEYPYTSLKEVIEETKKLDHFHEGFVIEDRNGNRVKAKSPEYLRAAKFFQKGYIGEKEMVELILTESLDDFLAYFPTYNRLAAKVSGDIEMFINQLDAYWFSFGRISERKIFAEKIGKVNGSNFLFKKYTNPNFDIKRAVLNLAPNKLSKMLGYKE